MRIFLNFQNSADRRRWPITLVARAFTVTALILLPLAIFNGCSQSNSRRSPFRAEGKELKNDDILGQSEMQVSVSSAGLPAQGGNDRLVYYIDLSKQDVNFLKSLAPNRYDQFASAVIERDAGGAVVGLRLQQVAPSSPLAKFGLQRGDTITAIGKTRASSLRDFGKLAELLEKSNRATITFNRGNLPRKILLSVK